DGIRDRNVTGVQTCALPIFFVVRWTGTLPVAQNARTASWTTCWPTPSRRIVQALASRRSDSDRSGDSGAVTARTTSRPSGSAARSEERRVGKERRGREGAGG